MKWLDIKTAPKGKVILTNEGTGIFIKGTAMYINDTGWYLCDMGENIPWCAEEGHSISRIYPSLWINVLYIYYEGVQ